MPVRLPTNFLQSNYMPLARYEAGLASATRPRGPNHVAEVSRQQLTRPRGSTSIVVMLEISSDDEAGKALGNQCQDSSFFPFLAPEKAFLGAIFCCNSLKGDRTTTKGRRQSDGVEHLLLLPILAGQCWPTSPTLFTSSLLCLMTLWLATHSLLAHQQSTSIVYTQYISFFFLVNFSRWKMKEKGCVDSIFSANCVCECDHDFFKCRSSSTWPT